jgi:hypothetical protein
MMYEFTSHPGKRIEAANCVGIICQPRSRSPLVLCCVAQVWESLALSYSEEDHPFVLCWLTKQRVCVLYFRILTFALGKFPVPRAHALLINVCMHDVPCAPRTASVSAKIGRESSLTGSCAGRSRTSLSSATSTSW